MSENVFIVENEGEKSSKREKFKEKYWKVEKGRETRGKDREIFYFQKYCSSFSSLAFRCCKIILFCKININNKKEIWNFDNQYTQFFWFVPYTINL
jgi:hypothetical protein